VYVNHLDGDVDDCRGPHGEAPQVKACHRMIEHGKESAGIHRVFCDEQNGKKTKDENVEEEEDETEDEHRGRPVAIGKDCKDIADRSSACATH